MMNAKEIMQLMQENLQGGVSEVTNLQLNQQTNGFVENLEAVDKALPILARCAASCRSQLKQFVEEDSSMTRETFLEKANPIYAKYCGKFAKTPLNGYARDVFLLMVTDVLGTVPAKKTEKKEGKVTE